MAALWVAFAVRWRPCGLTLALRGSPRDTKSGVGNAPRLRRELHCYRGRPQGGLMSLKHNNSLKVATLAILRQKGRPGTPKRRLWGALGRLWAFPGALVTASGANVRSCDTPLRRKTFSRLKTVPTRLPKRTAAEEASHLQRGGFLYVWHHGECFRVRKTTIQQKHSFAASKSN